MPFQQRQFAELLLGCETLPEPELDAQAFKMAVQRALKHLPPVYDPIARQMRPWINPSLLLGKSCGPGSRGECAIL